MYTSPNLDLFPYHPLPSHWNYGWDACDGRNAGKNSPMFQNFPETFLGVLVFHKPSSPPARALCFSWEITLTGAKYIFLNKQFVLYSMKAKKNEVASAPFTLHSYFTQA